MADVRSHPLYVDVNDTLAAHITAFDPTTWRSPRDAMADHFYSWDRPHDRRPGTQLDTEDHMTTADDNKHLIRGIIEEAFNEGRLDAVDDLFTADYVAHVPGVRSLPRGAAAFKAMIGMWRGAFGDLHMTIEHLVAEGDLVANRFTTTGTHSGPLFGIAPTGRTMVVHCQELHRIAGGRVAESWICDDIPGILGQLGAVASVTGAPA